MWHDRDELHFEFFDKFFISNVHVVDSKICSFQIENLHEISNKNTVAKTNEDVDFIMLMLKIFQFIHENVNLDVIYVLVYADDEIVN